jgi:hypothetical protein
MSTAIWRLAVLRELAQAYQRCAKFCVTLGNGKVGGITYGSFLQVAASASQY